MNRLCFFLSVCLWVFPCFVRSQVQKVCPPNIGFEEGNFNNWSCFIGKIGADGGLALSNSGPTDGRHTIIKNAPPFTKDPYGHFPVNCPNGSGYSIQLGNSSSGSQAESITYTYTIPPDENDFIIIYNYAVVFQNPNHEAFEQPRFSTKVYDESTGGLINCASFEFAASGNLPGFQKSNVAGDVFYKTWSPVTIKLYGYAGKTIRLEFTTNDCTKGGHFGYAYVDVNENCSSLISGNVYCNGDKGITLTSPGGFMEYHWFNDDFTKEIGTSNTLTFVPPPAAGTTYALQIVPFPGLGCLDTLYTTIEHSNESFTFNTISAAYACAKDGIDLTADSITLGSSPKLKYSYFLDPNQNELVPQPKYVQETGVYYIKATNDVGCNEMKPVSVVIKEDPELNITNPPILCYPATIDITTPAITQGSDPTFTLSYWYDYQTKMPLPDPDKITATGTYFIKGINAMGCANTKAVKAIIANYSVDSVEACDFANLTKFSFVKNQTTSFEFSLWEDQNLTVPLPDPAKVKASETYFIQATVPDGCSVVKPVVVSVLPVPAVIFQDPVTVMYPKTVDLSTAIKGGTIEMNYGYWKDPAFTIPVTRPHSIDLSGTYYITVKNDYGCGVNFTAKATIDPPPLPKVIAPNIFSPNNDGINDLFSVAIDGIVEIKQFRIYDRWSQLVFTTNQLSNFWNGKINGKPVPGGTYYWVLDGNDIYRKQKFSRTGYIAVIR